MNDLDKLKVFSLGSNDLLAEKIAGIMSYDLGKVSIENFADGEIYIQFLENLREKKVFLIQSTNPPAESWMKLWIGLDAVRRAGGRPIAVIPYFGYARQERKSAPREPITASLVARFLDNAGARGILVMDLHANAIEGFFQKAKFDQIYARPVFLEMFKDIFEDLLGNDKLVLGSPDASGAGPGRSRAYAKHLGQKTSRDIPLVIIDKRRDQHNQTEVMNVLGRVNGKTVVFIDDMFDTCNTIIKAAEAVLERGAVEVYAAATHGVFSKDALDRLESSPVKQFFVTDTIYNERVVSFADSGNKLKIISVAKIFADAIRNISRGESVSQLFD